MNTKHVLFATVTLSVACFGGQAVEIEENPEIPQTRWQGALASPPNLAGAVQVNGTAWMATGDAANETRVQIEIANAAPGGVHPWRVQQGRCGSNGTPFGEANAYDPLEIDGDGEATARATVTQSLPRDGQYSVEVLASPQNMDLIVACANLAPPVSRADF